MYISKVSVVNYRNFKNVCFLFSKGINTIIGENASGKTNLFRAIRFILDANMYSNAFKLNERDFNRSIGDWKGHWIIISIEFKDISDSEEIQALFSHGIGRPDVDGKKVEEASYNLFFRPNKEIREKLSCLKEGDIDSLNILLGQITIDDYETVFSGKSTADFNNPEFLIELEGDFEHVRFNNEIDQSKYGIPIPHTFSIKKEVNFTFIKAFRNVIDEFKENKTNPLLALLRYKSKEIKEDEYAEIVNTVKELNEKIGNHKDVKIINQDIIDTIMKTVGTTYSPTSIQVKANLPAEAERLLQSLQLHIGEPDDENPDGSIYEMSLGGANLIYLTLKLLEFQYKKDETISNFIVIEEPEAHIHTHIQKTLFRNIDYEKTQIIYSTHSTQISEASNISNMNILGKKYGYSEVYQPWYKLTKDSVMRANRYLDATRSNILFAKSTILVEGDAEEIVIPYMVQKAFGLSLDEMGISLINIRSTGFKNVACLFHDDRIKKRCAIITDSDTMFDEKGSKEAEVKGIARLADLNEYSKENQWLNIFAAEYTFEVDFIKAGNEEYAIKTLNEIYKKKETIDEKKNMLKSKDVVQYGRCILSIVDNQKKRLVCSSIM